MTKDKIDIDELLLEISEVKQSKYNGGRFNKTSLFILPMIELSYKVRWLSKYMVNAFLDDGGIEHDFVRPIFILMKVKNQKDRDWLDFCKSVTTLPLFSKSYVTDYYVGTEDGHHLIMYVFSVLEKWSSDYELFVKGRYSKMSDKYKSIFPQEVYLQTGGRKESQIWGALHKSENLKDVVTKEFINPGTSSINDVIAFRREMDSWDEIWDKPNVEEEIYHYKEKSE